VIAGASDADPTTVATIAVIDAGTIYGLGWLTLLLSARHTCRCAAGARQVGAQREPGADVEEHGPGQLHRGRHQSIRPGWKT
jgi:hypothetical protein